MNLFSAYVVAVTVARVSSFSESETMKSVCDVCVTYTSDVDTVFDHGLFDLVQVNTSLLSLGDLPQGELKRVAPESYIDFCLAKMTDGDVCATAARCMFSEQVQGSEELVLARVNEWLNTFRHYLEHFNWVVRRLMEHLHL